LGGFFRRQEIGCHAASHQFNKGREELRTILSTPVSPEQTEFPFAAQAAKLDRLTSERKPQQVVLLTSLPPRVFLSFMK